MEALDRFLNRFERGVIGACFTGCLLLLMVSVLTRYLFRWPMSFGDELSTYLFILMTFLGAAAAVRNNSELRVDALVEAFPKLKRWVNLFVHLCRMLAAVIFIVYGIRFVAVEWEFKAVTPILEIPFTIINGFLPLFGVILILRTLLRMPADWRKE